MKSLSLLSAVMSTEVVAAIERLRDELQAVKLNEQHNNNNICSILLSFTTVLYSVLTLYDTAVLPKIHSSY